MEGHQQRAVPLEVTSKHAAGTYDFQTLLTSKIDVTKGIIDFLLIHFSMNIS